MTARPCNGQLVAPDEIGWLAPSRFMTATPLLPIPSAFLATLIDGPWVAADLDRRVRAFLGDRPRGVPALIRRLIALFPETPTPNQLRQSIVSLSPYQRLAALNSRLRWAVPEMIPRSGWRIPVLATPQALADWAGIAASRLDWLADRQGRNARAPDPRLRHYWDTSHAPAGDGPEPVAIE